MIRHPTYAHSHALHVVRLKIPGPISCHSSRSGSRCLSRKPYQAATSPITAKVRDAATPGRPFQTLGTTLSTDPQAQTSEASSAPAAAKRSLRHIGHLMFRYATGSVSPRRMFNVAVGNSWWTRLCEGSVTNVSQGSSPPTGTTRTGIRPRPPDPCRARTAMRAPRTTSDLA